MSDSDSSCGVVIPGYQQPSVKMVKRDRHRELAYHPQNHACSEDIGGHSTTNQRATNREIRVTDQESQSHLNIESRDLVPRRRVARRSTMDHYEPSRPTNTKTPIDHRPDHNIDPASLVFNRTVQSRPIRNEQNKIFGRGIQRQFSDPHVEEHQKSVTRDNIPDRSRETKRLSKNVDISDIDKDNTPNVIATTEDNSQSESFRRRNIPSSSEDFTERNMDSKSLGINRGVQSRPNRDDHNNYSRRGIQRQASEPIVGHQTLSQDNIPESSRDKKWDPNIPSFLSIPTNHESMNSYEESNHGSPHNRKDNLKDTTTTIPLQENRSTENLVAEQPSSLMVAASELETMRNQLQLYLHHMNNTRNSDDTVVEVNILSPPTPLPRNSFPRQLLEMVRLLPGNDKCSDCGEKYSDKAEDIMKELKLKVDCTHIGDEGLFGRQQDKNGHERLHSWASVSYGIVLCAECAYRHYAKSKKSDNNIINQDIIKSLNGRDWTLPDVIAMLEGGNNSIIQYFGENANEGKTHEMMLGLSVRQRNSLLGSTCVVANLGGEDNEVKQRNPDIKIKAYSCAFDTRYASSTALSYRKLLSKRILAFGSKWQIWM